VSNLARAGPIFSRGCRLTAPTTLSESYWHGDVIEGANAMPAAVPNTNQCPQPPAVAVSRADGICPISVCWPGSCQHAPCRCRRRTCFHGV